LPMNKKELIKLLEEEKSKYKSVNDAVVKGMDLAISIVKRFKEKK